MLKGAAVVIVLTVTVAAMPAIEWRARGPAWTDCSEMLSLSGKIAALYVQDFDDATAIASTNEVELLCTGLSQKIWQKIMILESLPGEKA